MDSKGKNDINMGYTATTAVHQWSTKQLGTKVRYVQQEGNEEQTQQPITKKYYLKNTMKRHSTQI